MAEVFTRTDEAALEAAQGALLRGDLVVLPTDTVYGVAASPQVPGATERIFEAKRRTRGLALPVLGGNLPELEGIARFDDPARRLAQRFWPGGLTLVLPRTDRSAGWDLGEERGTVAVRVPDHADAVALLLRTGPLAVTSANRSGESPPETCEGARADLGEQVAVYLCADPAGGVPSTVVDLSVEEPKILRQGVVGEDVVLAALVER